MQMRKLITPEQLSLLSELALKITAIFFSTYRLLRYQSFRYLAFLFLFSEFGISGASAQNAIQTENAKPGNLESEWQISGAGDLAIQGFATNISYNKGETARFKIKSNSAYSIRIYRLGF
jgi:hypothetical protein